MRPSAVPAPAGGADGGPDSACGTTNAAATAAPDDGDGADQAIAEAAASAAVALRVHARTAVGGPEDGALDERARRDEEAGQGLLRFGDDGELALESLARPPEQRLDRPDLDALVVRDLLVRPPGAFAHGEHVAVAGGKAVERAVDQLAVDRGQHEVFGGVGADDADRLLRGELHVVGGRAARAAAQHVGADVAGDDGEPGVEALVPGEARQRLPGAGERLLRRVLGLVTVVQPAETETEEPLVVARVEVPERGRVAGLAPLDERAVAIQIDVVAKARELFLAERHLSRPSPLQTPPARRFVTLWRLLPGSQMPPPKIRKPELGLRAGAFWERTVIRRSTREELSGR